MPGYWNAHSDRDWQDDCGMYDPPEDGDWEDGPEPGDECGRWDNGRLGPLCRLAGTEFCDFECPFRDGGEK